MSEREGLGQVPAKRGAQDVNALETQCVEECGGSRRHRTDIVEIRGVDGHEWQGRS
jgi:hypothetical protein